MENKKKYIKCCILGTIIYLPFEEAKDFISAPISEDSIIELTDNELAEIEGRAWIY